MSAQHIGYFGLFLVLLIILAVIAGCQTKATSFSATCALVVIGQNEQGITFVKQHCEIE